MIGSIPTACFTGAARDYFGNVYSGAAAHFGLQDRYSYDQTCVRVRRSSDNAEADFTTQGVINGSLTSWTGANNGFITTLYDLTGGGNHLEQSTAGSQPRLVSSGSVVTENGVPVVDFGSTSDAWNLSGDAATSSYLATAFVVLVSDQGSYGSSGGAARLANFGFDGTDNRFYFGAGTSYTGSQFGANFGAATNSASVDAPTSLTVISALATPSLGQVWFGGTSVLTANPNESGAGITKGICRVGGDANGYLDGRMAELVVYYSNKSADRAAIVGALEIENGIA